MQEETGLNILAITIFTITLSVLLGPLINLSPIIPAGVTFILLGLVTIDTLSLQNKGVNLLVDIFASEEKKARIIHHEAGHFLTAYLLEIPITDYTLTAWETLKKNNNGSGGVIFNTEILQSKQENLTEFNLFLERIGIVLMAGIAAEKFIYDDSQGGEEDKFKFNQLYAQVGLTFTNLQMKQRQGILQARSLIEKNQDSYLALVEAMKNRKTVLECQEIIDQYK